MNRRLRKLLEKRGAIIGAKAIAEAWAGGDLDALRDALRIAVEKDLGEDRWAHIESLTPEKVVVAVDGVFTQYDWMENADGGVAISNPVKVEQAWKAITEAAAADQMIICEAEAAADGGAPDTFRVRVLKAGPSLAGGRYYEPEELQRIAEAHSDLTIPIYDGSDQAHRDRMLPENMRYSQEMVGDADAGKTVGGVSGFHYIAEADKGGPAVFAVAKMLDVSSGIGKKVSDSMAKGMPSLIGLSPVGTYETAGVKIHNGRPIPAPQGIRFSSVDTVANPTGGGGFLALAEAATTTPEGGADNMDKEKLIAALTAKGVAKDKLEGLDDKALQAMLDGLNSIADENADKDKAKAEAEAEAEAKAKADAEAAAADKGDGKVDPAEAKRIAEAAVADAHNLFAARTGAIAQVNRSDLKQAAKDRLIERINGTDDTKMLAEAAITTLVQGEKQYLADATGNAQVDFNAPIRVSGGSELTLAEAAYAMLDPAHEHHSTAMVEIGGLQGLYYACGGRHKDREFSRGRLVEAAVNSQTFDQILGDGINRYLLKMYQLYGQNSKWEMLVGTPRTLTDFRQIEIMKLGGYGKIPKVLEGGRYQDLVHPTEERATYSPDKFGGVIPVTFEMIRNNDMGVIQRLVEEAAKAMQFTLNDMVFQTVLGLDENNAIDNSPIYDGAALYSTQRGNLGNAAFSADAFRAADIALRKVQELSSNRRMNHPTKNIICSIDLEPVILDTMVRDQSERDVPETKDRIRKCNVISWEAMTDTNDWYQQADPMMCPAIEIGFLDGKKMPEIFNRSNMLEGEGFTNEVLAYKVRHIFGFAIVDNRPLRANRPA